MTVSSVPALELSGMPSLTRQMGGIKTQMTHCLLVSLARGGIKNNIAHLLSIQGNIDPAI
jgi:hypothetical protein